MEITLNNNKEIIPKDELTVDDLLKWKNYSFKMLVIKINGTIIRKHEYSTTQINEGDYVVVLHLVSGG